MWNGHDFVYPVFVVWTWPKYDKVFVTKNRFVILMIDTLVFVSGEEKIDWHYFIIHHDGLDFDKCIDRIYKITLHFKIVTNYVEGSIGSFVMVFYI